MRKQKPLKPARSTTSHARPTTTAVLVGVLSMLSGVGAVVGTSTPLSMGAHLSHRLEALRLPLSLASQPMRDREWLADELGGDG